MQLLIGSRATSISSTDFWIINELSWLNMTDTLLLSSSITNVCGNFGKIINSLSSGLAQVRRSWIETSLVHPCEDLFKRTVQKIMRWQPDLKQIYITLKSRQMSVVIRYYFLEFSNHCKIKLNVSIICYCSNFFTWSGFTEVVNNFQFFCSRTLCMRSKTGGRNQWLRELFDHIDETFLFIHAGPGRA